MSGSDRVHDDAEPHANDDGHDPEDQLVLAEDDERLPWLESGEEEEYEDAPDIRRVVGLVLLGLVALAAIVGGIWWSTNRPSEGDMLADGGTIKAPDQPFKEAPKNPGGKTFEGTGDTAFAVSEGQTRAAKLGQSGAAPSAAASPSIDLSPKPPVPPSPRASSARPASAAATAPATKASAPAAAQAPPGTLVQVGAYSSRALAEAAWSRLIGRYDALSGQRHQIVEGKADIGTVFRLQALPGSSSAAHGLCGRLKSSGLACQVK